MLSDDMSGSETEKSQDTNLRSISNVSSRKRSIITVDGVQSALVEVMTKRSKKFRVEWMEETNFKDWLKPHPSDETYCICVACDIKLRCGKSELEKHASGLKHSNRVEAMKIKLNMNEDKSLGEDILKSNSESFAGVQPTRIFCDETGSSYLDAVQDQGVGKFVASTEETFPVPESTVSETLLKVLEMVEGKISFAKKKQEMEEIEHKCRMQILNKELQLKSLEVQIKEIELQKLKCTGGVAKSLDNHLQ